MLYKLVAVAMMLTAIVATPDYDDYMNQDCGQVDECE